MKGKVRKKERRKGKEGEITNGRKKERKFKVKTDKMKIKKVEWMIIKVKDERMENKLNPTEENKMA